MSTLTFDELAARLEESQPLSQAEVEQLTASHDILTLGSLADIVRRRRHGAATTFLRVAELEIGRSDPGTIPAAARELRLVGAVDSEAQAIEAVRRAAAVAGGVPVSGFNLGRLARLAGGERQRLEALLKTLRSEGLVMLAEAPLDSLVDWRGALAAAAAAEIAVPRLTVDSAAEGLPSLLARLHEGRESLQSLTVIAPLPRRPGPQPTTGYEDVKAIALARIVLDVEHIQVDWRLHGPKLAQVALTVGASDVDNVPAEDDESAGRRRSPLEEILRNIHAAGLEPLERDARFARLS
jgi:aminodeoxyfutalosine synthase